ncbi:type VI secretion system baseplate subunit TssF [Chitiniphilus purpureus]|uniref:Type VI secretion system baseplate subunit TssF n=1 Tax=Chitiniphilus purpureus TaxID=2981137 RepID=A0ABY6DSD2_9NEIS|nr:type VI secretion system baseplate subunit TssF [Chitiniphilus sp. CD1]UXY17242.1 type VI secretion system baseplate subunit TssF [Chitiniphilus sp. CD1]
MNNHTVGTRLKDYFARELFALREDASEFAKGYPQVAHGLAPGRGSSQDPHVELLIQSFAFLTGRLRYQMEVEQATLPNTLLHFLYPHLEAPVPSMMVAHITVKPDGANFAKGMVLARSRQMYANAVNDEGRKLACRMRTCCDTPLWPLRVDEVRLTPIDEYGFLAQGGDVRSVLRVRLVREGAERLQDINPSPLRFYISSEERHAWHLYDMLAVNLAGIALRVRSEAGERVQRLPATALSWCGFATDEAMLAASPHTHPGYRLLQEYFAFPEKFLFFEVPGLDFAGADASCELLFLFNTPPDKALGFAPSVLKLNCVPLVNLFMQRIEPVALDHTQFEYRLRGDIQHHRHTEIYAIDELVSIRPNASPRPIAPYFAMDEAHKLEQQDYFFVTRREVSQFAQVPGTETFVSLLDTRFDPGLPADEVIGGRALCTNRRLPEQLRIGDVLLLEGAGPVQAIHVASKPTAHQTPQLIGNRPWALASQLALNHLSLADGPLALSALKDMLSLHVGPMSVQGLKQIDGIRQITCRPMVRHVGRDGWRGFAQGLHLDVDLDRSHFEEGSAVLFAEVLRRFFALYAAVNTLVELSLHTHDVKGTLKTWPPLIGAQPIL